MKIHETGTGHRTGWPHYVSIFYLIFIAGVIGTMVLHEAIDLRKRFRDVLRLPQTRRMSAHDVAQHMALAVTFIVLVVTGFALRYSEADVFRFLFGWDGGFTVRGVIHRVAGTLFLIVCVWHVLYLRSRPGRRFLRDMWPGPHDFRQFGEMMAYNLEKRTGPPRFGRFSYIEKAEYWALVWGAVIMGATGLLLWFDNFAVRYLPKGVLDVMLVIHFYEAWLAFLAILVWHMYSTVFNPAIYPGNPSWLTGKMPAAWHKHEHPAEYDPGPPSSSPAPPPSSPAKPRSD
jgi:formate dehydrogenase gamma subunit